MTKRRTYASRAAALRRRSGLTPYQQRLASALARGKTRAVARGHANEAAEKKARRRRIRQRYGVSPEALTRLRKQVLEHGFAILMALASSGKQSPVFGQTRRELPNRATMIAGIRRLPGETLREILELQAKEWQALASYSPGTPIEDTIEEYQNWTLLFDTGHAVHAGAADGEIEWNPWWYHNSGGYR